METALCTLRNLSWTLKSLRIGGLKLEQVEAGNQNLKSAVKSEGLEQSLPGYQEDQTQVVSLGDLNNLWKGRGVCLP